MTETDTTTQAQENFALVVEWDGGRPPTIWYDRLARYDLSVRGNKDKNIIDRRASSHGVVMQEGFIILESITLARTLAYQARSMGAKMVTIMRTQKVEMLADPADTVAFDRAEASFRRGRPAGNKAADQPRTFVCLEEMRSFVINDSGRLTRCPSCQSEAIRVFQNVYENPAVTPDNFSFYAWMDSRLTTGEFRSNVISAQPGVTPHLSYLEARNMQIISDETDQKASILEKSTLVRQVTRARASGYVTTDEALTLLDFGWRALKYVAPENLQENRYLVCMDFLRDGGDQTLFNIIRSDNDDLDMLDALAAMRGRAATAVTYAGLMQHIVNWSDSIK